MWAIGLVVGAFIGGAYDGAVGVLGAAVGLVAGVFAGSWKKGLLHRVTGLEARVDLLGRQRSIDAAAMPDMAPPPATVTSGPGDVCPALTEALRAAASTPPVPPGLA